MQRYIILQVRLPRVLLAALVGAGLSAAGGVFQGIFQNPLADPHILGVSSGAALGATIAILFGVQVSVLVIGTIGVCAFIGAILTIMLVYLIGGMKKGAKTIGILLTGTAISTLFSAVMSLLMSLNHDKIEQVYLWTRGSLSSEFDGEGRGDGTESWYRDSAYTPNFDFSSIGDGCRMCFRQRCDWFCRTSDSSYCTIFAW